MKKQLSFSSIKLKDLRSIVPIQPLVDDKVFKKWFDYDYTFAEEEVIFLENLISNNELRLNYYSEEDLKAKFIIPLLNKVNFTFGDVTDWYEKPMNREINGIQISGVTDYLVAKGLDEPELPYFFIQEFKPSKGGFPEYQLLAELLVVLNLNQEKQMLGAHIIGRLWTFMLVVKDGEGFNFMQSAGFNAMNIADLKKLFITLKAVKADIKAKIEN